MESKMSKAEIGVIFSAKEVIILDKISKPKTEAYKGNVYEVGKDYLFSMDGMKWTYDKFIGIDGGYSEPFRTSNMEWLYIKEVPASENMGIITPSPVPLIHGNAYTFDYGGNKDVVGVYDNKDDDFIGADGCFEARDCTSIRLMAIAEGSKS
jgi:hypothetical protein